MVMVSSRNGFKRVYRREEDCMSYPYEQACMLSFFKNVKKYKTIKSPVFSRFF